MNRVGFAPVLRLEDRVSLRRRKADLPTIRSLLALRPKVWLVDLGGGTGALAAVFAADGVQAVVLEPNARKVAYGRSHHPQVQFLEGRAEEIPFPDATFELATAMLSLHHMENPDRAVEEVRRVLVPSGRFLVQEFFPAYAPGALVRRIFGRRHGGHHRYYEPEELKAALIAAGLRDVVVRPADRTYYVSSIR